MSEVILRRVLAAAVAFLVSAIAASPPRSASGAEFEKVVIHSGAMSKTAVDWPHYVALEEGFYAREGLDVQQTIVDPPTTVSALIGGSLDIALADTTGLVLADDKGARLVAVGAALDRNPYYLMATPGIKTIGDLRGKKITAPSPIEIYTTVIKEMLRKGGLDPEKDVEWVFGGGQNQRLAALLTGAVNAGLFTSPAVDKLRKRGFASLAFAPDFVPRLALSVTAVRRDWAQQHGDLLRRYLRAESNAATWLNAPQNKARAIEILSKATNSTPDESETAYKEWIGGHLFPNSYCVDPSSFDSLMKILQTQKRLVHLTPADVGKFTDTQWCPKGRSS